MAGWDPRSKNRLSYLRVGIEAVALLSLAACGAPTLSSADITSTVRAAGPVGQATQDKSISDALATQRAAEINTQFTQGIKQVDSAATQAVSGSGWSLATEAPPLTQTESAPPPSSEPAASTGTPPPEATTRVSSPVTQKEALCTSIPTGKYMLYPSNGSQPIEATCTKDKATGKKLWRNLAGDLINGMKSVIGKIATVTPLAP